MGPHAHGSRRVLGIFLALTLVCGASAARAIAPSGIAHAATAIVTGDLIVSTFNADTSAPEVDEYTPAGAFVQTLITGAVDVDLYTGSAFDGSGNLYVTDFSTNQILKRDAVTGAVTVFSDNTILGDVAHPYNSPESIAFSADFSQMYISDANRNGPNGGIHEVSTATGAETRFIPIPTSNGSEGAGESDWLAFNAANNLFMTNENPTQGVMQVNLTSGDIIQPSFIPNLPNFGYAISFDKNGDLWVGDTDRILEYNSSGTLLNTITNANFNTIFAAVFDPTGTLFYAGDSGTGDIYTYNLSGTQVGTAFAAGDSIQGLSVAGAKLANQGQGCTVYTALRAGNKSLGILVKDDIPPVSFPVHYITFSGGSGVGVFTARDPMITQCSLSALGGRTGDVRPAQVPVNTISATITGTVSSASTPSAFTPGDAVSVTVSLVGGVPGSATVTDTTTGVTYTMNPPYQFGSFLHITTP